MIKREFKVIEKEVSAGSGDVVVSFSGRFDIIYSVGDNVITLSREPLFGKIKDKIQREKKIKEAKEEVQSLAKQGVVQTPIQKDLAKFMVENAENTVVAYEVYPPQEWKWNPPHDKEIISKEEQAQITEDIHSAFKALGIQAVFPGEDIKE